MDKQKIGMEKLTSMLKMETAVTKVFSSLSADEQKVYLAANPNSRFKHAAKKTADKARS